MTFCKKLNTNNDFNGIKINHLLGKNTTSLQDELASSNLQQGCIIGEKNSLCNTVAFKNKIN
jgi:hypothetical protein